jgi:hypothetical protein
MNKGFGYLHFLFFLLVLVSLIISFSTIVLRFREAKILDLAALKAQYYADSAAEYQRKLPALPQNKLSAPDLEKLKKADGIDYHFKDGGFKIVENKGTIYFLGFTGPTLEKADSIRVLKKQGEFISPWYE